MSIPIDIPEGKFIRKDENGKYTIFSGLPEFGYELIAVLPLAYYLYKHNLLNGTISGYDTAPLYYFSPHHQIIDGKRSFKNAMEMGEESFPNILIHFPMDFSKFEAPDLKNFYSKRAIKFNKKTFIIHNRYSKEWNNAPINYIDKETIKKICLMLRDSFQIVLIQASDFPSKYDDDIRPTDYGFDEKECDDLGLITLKTLIKTYPALSINELQCCLFAGCSDFISSNGGGGILISYFGGSNIIFSKNCRELDPDVNSFYNWYYKFGDSIIQVVSDEERLVKLVESKYIKKDKLFNIIVRTSGRPNYYHDCIHSIMNQNYLNYRILSSIDNSESLKYAKQYPVCICEMIDPLPEEYSHPKRHDYGSYFPYNEYFNKLQTHINEGYIIYLDDDDAFATPDALKILNEEIKASHADVVFWRVQFPNRLVPNDEHWEKRIPICKDISGIGYAINAKYKPHWGPWKRGDYRIAIYLYDNVKNISFCDRALTRLQRKIEDGLGRRDDKSYVEIYENNPLALIIPFNELNYRTDNFIKLLKEELATINLPHVDVYIGINNYLSQHEWAQKYVRENYNSFYVYGSKKPISIPNLLNSLITKNIYHNSLLYIMNEHNLLIKGTLKLSIEEYMNKRNKRLEPTFDHSVYMLNPFIIPQDIYTLVKSKVSDSDSFDDILFDAENSLFLDAMLKMIEKFKNGELSPKYIYMLKYLFSHYINKEYQEYYLSKYLENLLKSANNELLISHTLFTYLGGFNIDSSFYIGDFLNRAKSKKIAIIVSENTLNILVPPFNLDIDIHELMTQCKFEYAASKGSQLNSYRYSNLIRIT